MAKDIESKADKSDIENVAYKDDLTTKLDVSVFNQEKDQLATKEELDSVEDKIITKTSQLENDAGFLTEHQSLDHYVKTEDISAFITMKDVEDAGYLKEIPDNYITDSDLAERGYITDISGKSDVGHTHSYNELNDLPEIPSIDGLATTDYVDNAVSNISIPDVSNFVSRETLNTELSKKSNNILFTDNYVVTTPAGGFSENESVQNMTIAQIITKLLGLTLYVPPIPEIELPDSSPEIAVEIVDKRYPVSVLNEEGKLVAVTNPDDFYREMGIEEAKLDNQEESFFYQIVDDNGEVVESGYQVSTIYQENDYLTILISNSITNFHVEEYSALAGDWSQPTWKLVENPTYVVDGFTAYTVPEEYGILSGIAIRIVIYN